MKSPKDLLDKLRQVVREELTGLHPKHELLSALGKLIPAELGTELRGELLKQVGFSVGEGTHVMGQPRITGGEGMTERLHVGRHCLIEVGCTFDLEDRITLQDHVTLGHQVMILTSSHELGPPEHRAGKVTRAPVVIERGAWVGARCIILPGVVIGAGAIVSPGSLVNKDVAANTRVAGTPARQVEALTS